MGESSSNLKKFLLLHPKCCFCGGNKNADSRDHLPPKSAFLSKHAPEGYVFPACSSCNQKSSNSDRIFAMISKVAIDSYSEEQRVEFEKLCNSLSLQQSRPKFEFLTANQKKSILRNSSLLPPIGQAYGEVLMVSIESNLINEVENVLRKLAKALHYLHTNKILKKDDLIFIRSYSNLEILSGALECLDFSCLNSNPIISRNKVDLRSQFNYRYGITESGHTFVSLIKFGQSFYSFIMTSSSHEEAELIFKNRS
jgi:hypothetical protein